MRERTGNSMGLKAMAAAVGIALMGLCETAYADGLGSAQASSSAALTVSAVVIGRCTVSSTGDTPVDCGPGKRGRSANHATWTRRAAPPVEGDEPPATPQLEVYF